MKLKKEIDKKEEKLVELDKIYQEIHQNIPNILAQDVPEGKDDSENVEIFRSGEPTKFDFPVKDHLELANDLDLVDFERGGKVAMSGFYYLKNKLALLDLALQKYGMDKLTGKGFLPIITPDIAKDSICWGTGYNPRGKEKQVFNIASEDSYEDDELIDNKEAIHGLSLVGTAEITLGGYYADEIIPAEKLPIKFVGLSHCFRVEKGGYGRYSRGLYRVRQFSKVEMFVICKPEDSEKMHQELLAIEKEIWDEFEIPYRVVIQCTGDMSSASMKTYDLEAWMPGREGYGEVTSTSNTGDYQSRRLNVRYKEGNSKENVFVHMLNGTVLNNSRFPLTIIENYQQKDGSIRIPDVLVQYTGFDKIDRS